ncbi:MAG: adenylosuccinate synthase [Anaerolineales bacterium]|jgi:adenylosuccinate synthase|nr:adenylosuccinate synthase [Anaerolineales bacterium]
MPVTAVIGSQWGDEAKGKLVDVLCQQADIVARFNGGDNAGHTVINQYGTFKLRLTPNGFYNPQTICIIGPGVVLNLATLLAELEMIEESGIELSSRLWLSPRCHLIMPYHPMLESIYEEAKGGGRTGTTRRGIGPVYADMVSYNGLRLADLANEALFSEKLRVQLAVKNKIFEAFGMPPLDYETVRSEKLDQYARVQAMVREPFGMLQNALQQSKSVLLEGAQASLLDNTWGTYPFVTASNTLAGGSAAGLGLAPRWLGRVIGVAKAYTTRVGAGPMPTELFDEAGQILLQEGQEFGTVTGRPRRCGWFDAALVRFTAQLNGMTELALTKLDVLDNLPRIKLCVGYRMPEDPNRMWEYWEGDAAWLAGVEPVYIEMEGWLQPTRQIRDFALLPHQAQAYVQKIEELVGIPVKAVSVGPDREETIWR